MFAPFQWRVAFEASGVQFLAAIIIYDAGRLRAEPVFKFEILDLNADASNDLVFTYGPGINIYAGKYIRFMVHGEFRRAEQRSALRYRDRELLMVQLCFDI